MGTDSTNQEDIEIRLMRELTDIRVQLQELKSMFNNNDLKFKMAIAEHQTHCPMLHKKVLTNDDCFTDWKICKEKYDNEQAKHLQAKQKKFINWVEVFKALAWMGTFIGGISYLKG